MLHGAVSVQCDEPAATLGPSRRAECHLSTYLQSELQLREPGQVQLMPALHLEMHCLRANAAWSGT
ncbi:hypothetical protein AD006_29515 (plasmid) [Pseudonocardia sp. EC080610-09]|nr:hypothetical protein AD006_29515 [Pseudonocardia sp. EC080610-09]ALL85636.1 hypothetical protein AD017_31735 [Pseudonocardia sp. EC080619-01]